MSRPDDVAAQDRLEPGSYYRIVWTAEGGEEHEATGRFIGEDHPWLGAGFAFDRKRQAGGVFVVARGSLISAEPVR